MTHLAIFLAIAFGVPALLAGTAFVIPAIVDRIGGRIPAKANSPAAMIARAMTHPATTHDWVFVSDGVDRAYVNEKMGLRVRRGLFSGDLDIGVPTSWRDQKMLQRAVGVIQARIREEADAAAIARIAEQFERAYGNERASNVVPIRATSVPE